MGFSWAIASVPSWRYRFNDIGELPSLTFQEIGRALVEISPVEQHEDSILDHRSGLYNMFELRERYEMSHKTCYHRLLTSREESPRQAVVKERQEAIARSRDEGG